MTLPYYNSNKEYESNLSEARIQAGLTVDELCKAIDIHPADYDSINSGIRAPIYHATGKPKPIALKLSELLGMSLSDLFPLYFCEISQHRELSVEEIIENFHPELLAHEYSDPETLLLEKEEAQLKRDMLERMLSRLTDESRCVIELRFFEELYLDEIGRCFDLSKERIRQIEKQGLNRLRDVSQRINECRETFGY